MRTSPLFYVSFCLAVLSGCARPGYSTFSNIPPSPVQLDNEVLINEPFDHVWDRLVRGLSRSFFVVNNIDKSSHLINVSFSVDNPEAYIDCGISRRTYTRGVVQKEYVYKVAESSSYMVATAEGESPVTLHIDRGTSLEGRINIYVAPQGDDTFISVNCKYIFTASTSGTWAMEDVLGTVTHRGTRTPSSSSINFNTNSPQRSNWGTAAEPSYVTCQSLGTLEAEILDMARNAMP